MSQTPAIELRGITKAFGSKVVANKNVNLIAKRGEILSILGENGSGKTTLMNMIAGIYIPDEGQIFVNGEEGYISTSSLLMCLLPQRTLFSVSRTANMT